MNGVWSSRFYENTCLLGTNADIGRVSLGVTFEASGFETGYFGKWHLGQSLVAPYQSTPHLRGWEVARAWNTDGMRTYCVTLSLEQLGFAAGTKGNYFRWPTISDGVESLSTTHYTDAILWEVQSWLTERRGPDRRAAIVSFNTPHKPFYLPPGETAPPNPTDRDLYEAMVRDMDRAVGDLIASLLPDTWIISSVTTAPTTERAHPRNRPVV